MLAPSGQAAAACWQVAKGSSEPEGHIGQLTPERGACWAPGSHSLARIRITWGLVKNSLLSPTPEFLIQRVSCGPENVHSSEVPTVVLVRTAPGNPRCNAETGVDALLLDDSAESTRMHVGKPTLANTPASVHTGTIPSLPVRPVHACGPELGVKTQKPSSWQRDPIHSKMAGKIYAYDYWWWTKINQVMIK